MRKILLKRALLGTEKSGIGPEIEESVPSGIRGLIDQIEKRTSDDSWKILLAAGTESLADQVAFHPKTESTPLSLSERSENSVIPPPVAEILLELLQVQSEALGTPFTCGSLFLLDEAVKYGGVVPDEKIPDFLRLFTASRQYKNRKERLLPFLGKTANWLGSLNSDWQWCAEGSEKAAAEMNNKDLLDLWEEGNFAERKSALISLRKTDPDQARDLLQETWKNEKADHREAFLRIFESDLKEEDTAFLTSALSDRGSGVRRAAGDLLTRLTRSEYSQRMCARTDEILFSTSDKKYRIELIEKLTPEMKKDGLEEKPPYGTGEKIWWTFQILSRTPLAYLEKKSEVNAAEFLGRYRKDDLFSVLAAGCTNSLILSGTPLSWFEPLWNIWLRVKLDILRYSVFDLRDDLLEYGIKNNIEYFRNILDHGDSFSCSTEILHLIWSALAEHEPDPRRPEFSRALVNYLRKAQWQSSLLIEFIPLLPEHDREILEEYCRPGSVICKEPPNKMRPVQRIMNLCERFEKYIKSRKETE
ncbi:MAG: DUF5691 domain-containing protein [Planctomycetia bacterium]|nr:DUF5691 domain-containing protein [Planctomycetia bacterium]